MKKRFLTIVLIALTSLSLLACGGSDSSNESFTDTTATKTETTSKEDATKEEPADEKQTETSEDSNTSSSTINVDMDKCIADLKAGLSLEPDYSFVQDYYIGVEDKNITITAVVDDATDPALALDFADTLVRQLNLYAQMQDSSIESSSQYFYGGLYTHYDALVGIAPASKTNSQKDWFVYDGIVGGKVMLKLNKQYR